MSFAEEHELERKRRAEEHEKRMRLMDTQIEGELQRIDTLKAEVAFRAKALELEREKQESWQEHAKLTIESNEKLVVASIAIVEAIREKK